MNFRPELAEAVMAGRKTVTRRAASDNPRSPWSEDGCSLVEGRRYAVCPGRGQHRIGTVEVVRVQIAPLGEPAGRGDLMRDLWWSLEAIAEGFPDFAAFLEVWEALNGPWDADLLVWRVQMARPERVESGARA